MVRVKTRICDGGDWRLVKDDGIGESGSKIAPNKYTIASSELFWCRISSPVRRRSRAAVQARAFWSSDVREDDGQLWYGNGSKFSLIPNGVESRETGRIDDWR
ncbi:hypothetical protein U1Q18_028891 [Sarracenia purpurea var. burkii]